MSADLDELRRLRRARDRMDREYAQPLDVPALARTALMSTAHFSRRFNLAYHRNDGHLTNKEFGDRAQFLPERTLQVFESDLHGVTPGDRLHTAATKLVAQLSQYAFLAHCECRIGLHNSGPYAMGEIVRPALDRS